MESSPKLFGRKDSRGQGAKDPSDIPNIYNKMKAWNAIAISLMEIC